MEIIKHHGVDGQKWGVRNGPPYPLDKASKSAIRRTKVLSKMSNSKYIKTPVDYKVKKLSDGTKVAQAQEKKPSKILPAVLGGYGALQIASGINAAAIMMEPVIALPSIAIGAGVMAVATHLYERKKLREQFVENEIRSVKGQENITVNYAPKTRTPS